MKRSRIGMALCWALLLDTDLSAQGWDADRERGEEPGYSEPRDQVGRGSWRHRGSMGREGEPEDRRGGDSGDRGMRGRTYGERSLADQSSMGYRSQGSATWGRGWGQEGGRGERGARDSRSRWGSPDRGSEGDRGERPEPPGRRGGYREPDYGGRGGDGDDCPECARARAGRPESHREMPLARRQGSPYSRSFQDWGAERPSRGGFGMGNSEPRHSGWGGAETAGMPESYGGRSRSSRSRSSRDRSPWGSEIDESRRPSRGFSPYDRGED